ncbi:hypothetical protein [Bounagaea algeriensis]
MALGRTKSNRRQKDTDWPEEQVAEADQELDSYLAALTPEEDVESTGSGRRFGNSQVYQLRLPLLANERLKELAAKQGTSPAALARDWVLQHLTEPDGSIQEPTSTREPATDAALPGSGHAAQHSATDGTMRTADAPGAMPEEHAWPEQDFGLETQPAHLPVAPEAAPTRAWDGNRLPAEQTEEITIPHGQLGR